MLAVLMFPYAWHSPVLSSFYKISTNEYYSRTSIKVIKIIVKTDWLLSNLAGFRGKTMGIV